MSFKNLHKFTTYNLFSQLLFICFNNSSYRNSLYIKKSLNNTQIISTTALKAAKRASH